MGNGIKVSGLAELEKKLQRNATMSDVKQIVRLNGAELNLNAQRKAPVDTGFLRRSIVFQLASMGFEARVFATAEYAPYLEWGTRFMAAMPFMGPAFRIQKEKFKSDMLRLVR
ncbi:HK97-gp10 family putative phage morphogenesis protein [Candidatus Enterococcus ferrettii]|uniref:HK97 gp10 family phage protein n=1 Tax=Candidatus Enterococcus ferrettii TaxID=2815324 RepID=A0ABV0EKC5_9ENTE|nr:HK97-gp10 family putative phage morphogenesis protein [Enterococcus sp. 665A]MBO1341894.1 HK97 gp10 family phage protein [Enterococcus sp. 665A]